MTGRETFLDGLMPLTGGKETQVFGSDDFGDGETVMDFGDLTSRGVIPAMS